MPREVLFDLSRIPYNLAISQVFLLADNSPRSMIQLPHILTIQEPAQKCLLDSYF